MLKVESPYKIDKNFIEQRQMHQNLLSEALPAISRVDPLVLNLMKKEGKPFS